MRNLITICLALGGLAALAGPTRADILKVNGSGEPGTFSSLQAAVNAAAPGDTLLVDATLDTSAEELVIDGKGLTLIMDEHETFAEIRALTVRNVPEGQRVTMNGLLVIDATGVGVVCEDNAGELRFHFVRGNGKAGTPSVDVNVPARDGLTGAVFENCADVVLQNCGFTGGRGGDLFSTFEVSTSNGGLGVLAIDSRIAAYHTPFVGGRGGDVLLTGSTAAGGVGGMGLSNQGSTIFFHTTGSAKGGRGGNTQLNVPGGPGGAGMVQNGTLAEFILYGVPPAGGFGGDSQFGPDGPDGPAQLLQNGTTTTLPMSGQAWRMWTITPARVGESLSIWSTGFNTNVWVAVSLDVGHHYLPSFTGTLVLGTPFLTELLYLGHVPFFAVNFPLGTVPPLPPGVDLVELQVQAINQQGGTRSFHIGSPDHLVLLDADL